MVEKFNNGKGQVLRHGWGGNRVLRSQTMARQIAEAHEARTHPVSDSKFNHDGRFIPSAFDRGLLAEMKSQRTT